MSVTSSRTDGGRKRRRAECGVLHEYAENSNGAVYLRRAAVAVRSRNEQNAKQKVRRCRLAGTPRQVAVAERKKSLKQR